MLKGRGSFQNLNKCTIENSKLLILSINEADKALQTKDIFEELDFSDFDIFLNITEIPNNSTLKFTKIKPIKRMNTSSNTTITVTIIIAVSCSLVTSALMIIYIKHSHQNVPMMANRTLVRENLFNLNEYPQVMTREEMI